MIDSENDKHDSRAEVSRSVAGEKSHVRNTQPEKDVADDCEDDDLRRDNDSLSSSDEGSMYHHDEEGPLDLRGGEAACRPRPPADLTPPPASDDLSVTSRLSGPPRPHCTPLRRPHRRYDDGDEEEDDFRCEAGEDLQGKQVTSFMVDDILDPNKFHGRAVVCSRRRGADVGFFQGRTEARAHSSEMSGELCPLCLKVIWETR